MKMIKVSIALALILGAACRGDRAVTDPVLALNALVDSLSPQVEQATGLRFKSRPRVAIKTRDEVRDFLLARIAEEFPPERIQGITNSYRLLGFIPDTLDLKSLLVDLYTEQVAGFYDPDSTTLFAVAGSDPAETRLVIAHELVHALQHQYLPLDSLMRQSWDSDRAAASQAVLEGHATVASLRVLLPGNDLMMQPEFWRNFREQIRQSQSTMEVLKTAPLVLREGLIFPYLHGADFMRWWIAARAGQPLPETGELPVSTEQIIHPERYAMGDMPIRVAFNDSSESVLHEDTMGEMEMQILAGDLRGGEVITTLALGWGGDRYRVIDSPQGPLLLWWIVFDSEVSRRRFLINVADRMVERGRPGYRIAADSLPIMGRPGVRTVIAPAGWDGWNRLPAEP